MQKKLLMSVYWEVKWMYLMCFYFIKVLKFDELNFLTERERGGNGFLSYMFKKVKAKTIKSTSCFTKKLTYCAHCSLLISHIQHCLIFHSLK